MKALSSVVRKQTVTESLVKGHGPAKGLPTLQTGVQQFKGQRPCLCKKKGCNQANVDGMFLIEVGLKYVEIIEITLF